MVVELITLHAAANYLLSVLFAVAYLGGLLGKLDVPILPSCTHLQDHRGLEQDNNLTSPAKAVPFQLRTQCACQGSLR